MGITDAGERLARSGAGAVQSAAREASPWIVRLARVGYVAKGVLYAVVGLLAAQAAFGRGGGTTDSTGALRTLLGAPFGRALLAIVALGLLGYAVWRLVEAATDPDGRGSDAKGLATRALIGGSGVLHLVLAASAIRLAAGSGGGGGGTTTTTSGGEVVGGSAGGGSGGQQALTAQLLDAPGGRALVTAIGVGVIGFGLYQLYRAWAAKLSERLALGELPADSRRWAVAVSRAGIGARGVVFSIVGWLLVRAGTMGDAQQAGGTQGALDVLAAAGRWPLALVALGLVAYAAYELLNARYRRFRMA